MDYASVFISWERERERSELCKKFSCIWKIVKTGQILRKEGDIKQFISSVVFWYEIFYCINGWSLYV